MNRKINLGIVLLAVVLLGAVVVPVAQAEEEGKIQLEGGGTGTLTGIQTGPTPNEFEIPAGITECVNANFSASVTSGATEVTTGEPSYTVCTTAGQTSSVNFTGCFYKFTDATKTGSSYTGTVDLSCPKGKRIDILVVHQATFAVSITARSLESSTL